MGTALTDAIRKREEERTRLQFQLRQLEAVGPQDPVELRDELLGTISGYRDALRANPQEARHVLSVLFDQPLMVRPAADEQGWEVSGAGNLAGLLRLPPLSFLTRG
jgi:hypothetical protein